MEINNSRKDRIKNKLFADINMIPFIDIMLVLLIIFIINSVGINHGLELNLPKTEHKVQAITEQKNVVVISVKNTGELQVAIVDEDNPALVYNLAEVLAMIKQYKEKHAKLQLIIQSDADTSYENIAKLIAGLQHLEICDVVLATEPFDSDKES